MQYAYEIITEDWGPNRPLRLDDLRERMDRNGRRGFRVVQCVLNRGSDGSLFLMVVMESGAPNA